MRGTCFLPPIIITGVMKLRRNKQVQLFRPFWSILPIRWCPFFPYFSIFFTCFSHYSDFIFTPPSCQTMALPTYGHPIKTGQKNHNHQALTRSLGVIKTHEPGKALLVHESWHHRCKFQLEFNLTKSAGTSCFQCLWKTAWFLTFFGINDIF